MTTTISYTVRALDLETYAAPGETAHAFGDRAGDAILAALEAAYPECEIEVEQDDETTGATRDLHIVSDEDDAELPSSEDVMTVIDRAIEAASAQDVDVWTARDLSHAAHEAVASGKHAERIVVATERGTWETLVVGDRAGICGGPGAGNAVWGEWDEDEQCITTDDGTRVATDGVQTSTDEE